DWPRLRCVARRLLPADGRVRRRPTSWRTVVCWAKVFELPAGADRTGGIRAWKPSAAVFVATLHRYEWIAVDASQHRPADRLRSVIAVVRRPVGRSSSGRPRA